MPEYIPKGEFKEREDGLPHNQPHHGMPEGIPSPGFLPEYHANELPYKNSRCINLTNLDYEGWN